MSVGVGGVNPPPPPRLCNSPFRESFLNGMMIIFQDELLLQATNQLFFKGDI